MVHLKEKVGLVTGAASAIDAAVGAIGAAVAEAEQSASGTMIATDDALVEVT
jgi:hypothetical protein